jgi:hypothetical protein
MQLNQHSFSVLDHLRKADVGLALPELLTKDAVREAIARAAGG